MLNATFHTKTSTIYGQIRKKVHLCHVDNAQIQVVLRICQDLRERGVVGYFPYKIPRKFLKFVNPTYFRDLRLFLNLQKIWKLQTVGKTCKKISFTHAKPRESKIHKSRAIPHIRGLIYNMH